MLLILFPSQPFSPREIDPDFELEQAAAHGAGLATALIDHTRVVEGAIAGAIARVPEGSGAALYRGWMLKPTQYEGLHRQLSARGVALINSPDAYKTCHYLPESYRWIEGRTPRSVWLPVRGDIDMTAIAATIAPLASGPLVVKDYVKSQKHYWTEACFIPDSRDLRAVERVTRRFLELQAEDLNEGLVYRELAPLKIIGTHPKSGMPLAAEVRIFWLDGEPILCHRYWGDLVTLDAPLPFDELRPIAKRIPSRYFTMDVAFLADGGWTIVELGDGQVAGLPSPDLAPEFFRQLAAARTVDAPA